MSPTQCAAGTTEQGTSFSGVSFVSATLDYSGIANNKVVTNAIWKVVVGTETFSYKVTGAETTVTAVLAKLKDEIVKSANFTTADIGVSGKKLSIKRTDGAGFTASSEHDISQILKRRDRNKVLGVDMSPEIRGVAESPASVDWEKVTLTFSPDASPKKSEIWAITVNDGSGDVVIDYEVSTGDNLEELAQGLDDDYADNQYIVSSPGTSSSRLSPVLTS